MKFTAGQIVVDAVAGKQVVVVEDRGDRVLVSGLASLNAGASLVERAQWALPRADLFTAASA